MPAQGVIFDCDGTLLDSMGMWRGIEDYLAAQAGTLLSKRQKDLICSFTIPEVCTYFHREYGLGASPDAVRTILDDRMLAYYTDEVEARPGALDLVRTLAEHGIRCTIASSSPHDYLVAGLERCGFAPYLTRIFSVDDVGASKRERVIYDACRDAMGTTTQATWGFDDAVYALKVMAEAGYTTVGIYDRDEAGTFEGLSRAAAYAIHDFSELDRNLLLG